MGTKEYSKDVTDYINLIQTDGVQLSIDKDAKSTEMTLPDWYNEKLFKRAQKFYAENLFAMVAGKMAGLIAVLAIPSILDVLIFTKGSSIPRTAYKRYVETIFHTMSWYDHDLKPGSKSWISLEAVRKHHVQSSRAAERKQAGLISQKDLALTQFGFMGYITLRPNILGIQASRENYEAFVHFWRVIGHMIGIEDQFNLCTDSWETTKPRLEYLLNDIYRPALENASNSFYEMAYALIDGLWCYNPMLNRAAVMYFTKYLSKCAGHLYYESDLNALEVDIEHNQRNIETMNWAARFMLFFQVTVHGYLVNYWLFRWYFNMQVLFYKMLNTHLPILAMWKFGLEKAYVSIWQEDKNNKQL